MGPSLLGLLGSLFGRLHGDLMDSLPASLLGVITGAIGNPDYRNIPAPYPLAHHDVVLGGNA